MATWAAAINAKAMVLGLVCRPLGHISAHHGLTHFGMLVLLEFQVRLSSKLFPLFGQDETVVSLVTLSVHAPIYTPGFLVLEIWNMIISSIGFIPPSPVGLTEVKVFAQSTMK